MTVGRVFTLHRQSIIEPTENHLTRALANTHNFMCYVFAKEKWTSKFVIFPAVSPSPKRRKLSNSTPERATSSEHSIRDYATYFTELVLIDKQNRCQLTDGDYEVTLQQVKPKLPHFKRASWETISSSPVRLYFFIHAI